MISVIIPAFNEEKVIIRCLNALQVHKQQLDIIVVCNGCSDNTAEKVELKFSEATVIVTETASKTKAINLGLSQCKYKRVLLLDADIVFSSTDIINLASYVEDKSLMVASPKAEVELSEASFFVRAYYRITTKLPYYKNLKISAVIFLSDKGRKKLGNIPAIISDDDYIRLFFSKNEKAVIKELTYKLVAPVKYWDLIKILTRSHLGNKQLKKLYPQLFPKQNNTHGITLFRLSLDIRLLPSLFIFMMTKIVIRFRALLQFNKLSEYQWEKDESSRDIK